MPCTSIWSKWMKKNYLIVTLMTYTSGNNWLTEDYPLIVCIQPDQNSVWKRYQFRQSFSFALETRKELGTDSCLIDKLIAWRNYLYVDGELGSIRYQLKDILCKKPNENHYHLFLDVLTPNTRTLYGQDEKPDFRK